MNIVATPVLPDSQILGIDISKGWFDVFLHPVATKERFDNTPAGFRKLIRWLRSAAVEIAVMEATGGLEMPLFNALQLAGYEVARINPRWIRDFAKATGRSAKTDQQDARLIALYGAVTRPAPSNASDHKTETFKALCARRRQILHMKNQELNRQQQTQDRVLGRMIRQTIAFLDKQLAAVEAVIDTMIQRDADWRRRREIIESIPGFAATTARTLIADLPELGAISDKQVAALVGVAPITPYDEQHHVTYLRLLDAKAEGADWKEVARIVLHRDPVGEELRTYRCWQSHLERAQWLSREGYRKLLEQAAANKA